VPSALESAAPDAGEAASVGAVSVDVLVADDAAGAGVVECGSVIGVPMLSVTVCVFANGSGADGVACDEAGATCVCLSLTTGTV